MTLFQVKDGEHVALTTEEVAEFYAMQEAIANEPPRVPQVISRFQAKAALLQAGLLDDVEQAVAGSDALTQLAWAEAQELRRESPMVTAIAGALELTDEEVDDLFRQAAEITA